jgi:hypothetical protein
MTGHLRHLILLAAAAALAGCKTGSTVRITSEAPAAQRLAAARSEPVFYNGRTYRLDFAPADGGSYDVSVSGMGPKQRGDAVAVATSSLAYFACPDGQRGRLQTEPSYADARWRMQAKCG